MAHTYTVITSWTKQIFDSYGFKMAHSFVRYWDASIKLLAYEEGGSHGPASPRIEYFSLEACCEPLTAFRRAHPEPRARGKIKRDDGHVIYDYRFDAVKFAAKAFALSHGGRAALTERVIWLDADVVTHAPVTPEFLDTLLPEGCYVAYLGRRAPWTHSETGFLMFDATHPEHAQFMLMLAGVFASDAVFDLDEWNDAFVLDTLRRGCELGCEENGTVIVPAWLKGKAHDLSADLNCEHVFINSILGSRMDHAKGGRKASGHSLRSDLIAPRSEPYWQDLPG